VLQHNPAPDDRAELLNGVLVPPSSQEGLESLAFATFDVCSSIYSSFLSTDETTVFKRNMLDSFAALLVAFWSDAFPRELGARRRKTASAHTMAMGALQRTALAGRYKAIR
jgi:hypothetical protein